MILRLKLYDAVAYQDPWPPETEPSRMLATVVESELRSDDGGKAYTLGRLFFPPELVAEFGEKFELEIMDQREEPANV